MKYINSLTKLGLTKDQAKIYEMLLNTQIVPVRIIALQSGVTRELCYIVLKQLIDLSLVEKLSQGKVSLFRALNPRNIKKIIEQKKEETLSAEQSYQEIITKMVGDFNVNHNKPFIRFYEGIEGLQKTYGHIIRNAKTVRVLRSLYDYENEDIRLLVKKQIQEQAQKGIKSYILSPKLLHMKDETVAYNYEKNIIRKVIPKENFSLEAQVMIYDDTVSITSMRKEIITTIIQNEDIAKTFITLFGYMWDREN